MTLKEISSPTSIEKQRVNETKNPLADKLADCLSITDQEINEATKPELIRLMQVWRICAVDLLSHLSKTWNGKKAAKYLLGAKEIFSRYYNNYPVITEEAEAMRTDQNENEYQMKAEMFRDKGKYCLGVAELTGGGHFVGLAVGYFQEAIRAAETNTSAWAVATMEEEMAKKQLGEKINWVRFVRAYQTAVELSPHAGGWDRKAAISWWFAKESLMAGRQKDLKLGLVNLRSACKEGGVSWITRYPVKDATKFIMSLSRRLTAVGISPNTFMLPSEKDLAAGAGVAGESETPELERTE